MHEIFGPYQLIEKLASGGMAEIFKARTFGHAGFEKTLAIKRLHPRFTQTPEFVEMLKEEAKTAVGLSHANIVQIFDLGRVQEHYYIAMEYINGRDLNQIMNRAREQRQLVTAEAALYLAAEVSAGLDFAHRQRDSNGRLLRLIHRDVSPQNIMISQEGEVKIVDFGIAKSLASQQETEAGVIKGKFCFMSPEQARGQKLDHRTDIFSAGIILYELLTGRAMYDHEDDHQLLQQVRNAQFTPIESLRPDLPPAVHKVVNKALARERENRYPSARHLQHALEKVMQKSGLMFSRFQLGQLLANYFPQLAIDQDDILNSYDGFENEELSLISDYQANYNHRGDWEVPEFTDEIEDLEEVEELEEFTDELDSNMVKLAEMNLLSGRKATPLNAVHQFAPAAPPPNDAHLYDPSYQAPSSQRHQFVDEHAQVTQPPRQRPVAMNPNELYSSSAPSASQKPFRQAQHEPFHNAKPQDSFGQVESTFILGDEQPQSLYPRNTTPVSNEPLKHRYPRVSTSTSESLRSKLSKISSLTSQKLRSWISDPQKRYLIAGVGFVVVFLAAQLIKKQWIKSTANMVQLGSSQTVQIKKALGTRVKLEPAVSQQLVPSSARTVAPQRNPNQIVIGSSLPLAVNTQTQTQAQAQAFPPSEVMAVPSADSLPSPAIHSFPSSPNYSIANQRNLKTETFMLRIETEPPGAEVSINDEWHPSRTPLSVPVKSGAEVLLTFSKEGFEERREKIWPQINQSTIRFSLESQSGHLIINTSPEGATITRDGEVIGKTPFDKEDFPLKPTEFRVELSKKGYLSKAYRMSWLNADRGTLELDATLQEEEKPIPRRRSRPRPKRRSRPQQPSGSGFMSVKSSRWGHLFVDNRFVKEGKLVLKHKVNAGRHKIKFCYEGDRGNCVQKSISITNGDHQKVFF